MFSQIHVYGYDCTLSEYEAKKVNTQSEQTLTVNKEAAKLYQYFANCHFTMLTHINLR